MTLRFEVIGVPKPQGSMKAFSAGGHARMKPSGGADFAAWRNAVAQVAHELLLSEVERWARTVGGGDCPVPFDGPLRLDVEFRFPMPASRSKAVRTFGRAYKTTTPDTDKLVRCIGDALTASGLIADDARFAITYGVKVEVTGWTGADIVISQLPTSPE